MKMLSRNRVQMRYRKPYQSNRESKQRTRAMIVLVERYCITCILSLSTSRNDIYMYTRETLLDSSIIGSDLDLFPLTNYLVGMVRAVSRQCLKKQLSRKNERERERAWEVRNEWSTIFSVRDFCERNDITHNSWLMMLRAKRRWQKNHWSSFQLHQNFIIESHEWLYQRWQLVISLKQSKCFLQH